MTRHQHRVQVDHQTRHRTPATEHARYRPTSLGAEQPGPFPGLRPRPFQLRHPGLLDLGQDPPTRRIGGYRAEQGGLVPQHREISDRLAAVSEEHRHIGQHPPGQMRRGPLPVATDRLLQDLRDPDRSRDIAQ